MTWLPGLDIKVGGGMLLRLMKWYQYRGTSEAISVAREALTSASFVFNDSVASLGKLQHPWTLGEVRLEHRVLESRLLDARDRIASRRLRKHVDEVRTELQGLLDTRAMHRAAMGSSSPHIATDAEVQRKRESSERAEQQLQHAQRGALAAREALHRLGRISSRR